MDILLYSIYILGVATNTTKLLTHVNTCTEEAPSFSSNHSCNHPNKVMAMIIIISKSQKSCDAIDSD